MRGFRGCWLDGIGVRVRCFEDCYCYKCSNLIIIIIGVVVICDEGF